MGIFNSIIFNYNTLAVDFTKSKRDGQFINNKYAFILSSFYKNE